MSSNKWTWLGLPQKSHSWTNISAFFAGSPRARDAAELRDLYRETLDRARSSGLTSKKALTSLCDSAYHEIVEGGEPSLIVQAIIREFLDGFLAVEPLLSELPPEPDFFAIPATEAVTLRNSLLAKKRALATPGAVRDVWKRYAVLFCRAYLSSVPTHVWEARGPEETPGLFRRPPIFTLPIASVIDDLPTFLAGIIRSCFDDEPFQLGLFATLRRTVETNCALATGIPPEKMTLSDKPYVMPPDNKNQNPTFLVETYLRNTPFYDLFTAQVPFELPPETRFEHHWIVGGTGHGKTQTIQALIATDIMDVFEGKKSVVVIDSQGDLIRNISHLYEFGVGRPWIERLCLIDPTDIHYPVALNLFDVGMERINRYSPLDRERAINSVLELYDFVLGSLLSAELTQKQSVIFRYITRLMLHIPDATIHTFRELMEPTGYEKYKEHINRLQGTARAFFETEFLSKQFEDTKRQIVRRLWGILENQTFERMFSHPRNKLDIFSEMNAGKFILVNTAKELLKENGSQIFGRFIIAMIAQAAQERATLPHDKRTPCIVYIDEAQDYVDNNISIILEQARKFRVGVVLAHQYTAQLTPKLQEAFAANTSIKMAGGVSDKDARQFAGLMRTTADFVERQPKGSFATFVRNVTDTAVSLKIPFGVLEDMSRLNSDQFEMVREVMRQRYCGAYLSFRTAEEDEWGEDDDVRDSPAPKTTAGKTARKPSSPTKGTPKGDSPDHGSHTDASDRW